MGFRGPVSVHKLNWDSQQGRVRTTSISVRAFWNFQLLRSSLKYSRNCSLHNTLIPNLVKPLMTTFVSNKVHLFTGWVIYPRLNSSYSIFFEKNLLMFLRQCWERPKSDFQSLISYVKNQLNLFNFFFI